jgi:hypothetical protein
MRILFAYLSLLLTLHTSLEAAIRSDVVVIEASEGIRYSTQAISKKYLLSYLYPNNMSFRKDIEKDMEMLDENIKKISINTNSKKTKGILSYFATKRMQIVELMQEKADMDTVESMMEISEIFTEGSKSIASKHKYQFSKEEEMIMLTREMSIWLGEIAKYYMAININPKDQASRNSLDDAVKMFEKFLKKINSYAYDKEISNVKKHLNDAWRVMGRYLKKIDTLQAPSLLSIASSDLQNTLTKLTIYHSKNQ